MKFIKFLINKGVIYLGPIFYKPYQASTNKRNSKKYIIRKYEVGKKRFRDEKNMTNEKSNELDENNIIYEVPNEQDEKIGVQNFKASYQNAQKNLFENWKEKLPKFFNIMVENNALLNDQKCFKCENPAISRCLDCGPNVYFCSSCEELFHDNINIFHQRILLNQKNEKNHNKEILNLPQICLGKCEHQVFKILIIDLKGK